MSADGVVFRHVPDICLPLGPAALRRVTLPPRDADDAKTSLERVVDFEIGPRLVLFHHGQEAICPPERRPTRVDVERLAMLVIGTDEAATVDHFEKVRAQQHAYSTLLAYFLAPAAQFLGELWEQDVCDFFEVTIGIGRLQAFMDRLAAPEPVSSADVMRRALLIALPGETHLLGVRMVAKFLESTGWDVSIEEHLAAEENAKTVASEWFGVVGVSMSVASRVELAARTVAVVRQMSLNPHIAIMAGGKALVENPQLAFQIGADAVGYDAPTAVVLASHLLMRQTAMR
jgi:methanogenic corrinoid protein MtbC1